MRPGHCNEAGAPGTCSDCEGRWGLQQGEAVVVAASSSCPASARLGSHVSVATFRWRHFGSDISVATFRWRHFGGNISVAPFGGSRCHRVFLAASSSLRLVVAAPRRRRLDRYPHPSSWVT